MAHVVLLGLVLTLVAGVVSFAVLVRKIHARPSRLPRSIPTPLLLYNVWMVGWLVSWYLAIYLYPTLAPPVAARVQATSGCVLALLALAWLRSHLVLVDQFVHMPATSLATRAVGWLAWALTAPLIAGWGLSIFDPARTALFRVANGGTGALLFPVALAGSVLLAMGARRQQDDRERRALTVLSSSYVVLFSLLSVLVLVFWRSGLAGPAALLCTDLVLELAYNVLTVVWVGRYADAFAHAMPPDVDSAQECDAVCDRHKISAREREIIELICQGLTNQEIADRLFIALGTVKDHNYTIFQKVGVRNRTKLAQVFMRPTAHHGPTRAADRPSPGIRRVV